MTGYLVQTFDMAGAGRFVGQQEVTGTSVTVTGLVPGGRYAFLVYARNAAGYSAGTGSNTVTPRR